MQFGTNDDRDISNLLANVYGGEDGHYIAFVNVFLCKALAALYKATDNATNWYVIISVGFFLCFKAGVIHFMRFLSGYNFNLIINPKRG